MPPLNHEAFDYEREDSLEIELKEYRIANDISVLMEAVRYDEREKLTGLKAAFHYRKPVQSPAVYYPTKDMSGDYRIKAWLENSGGHGSVTSLYTQVVCMQNDGRNGEIADSLPASRLKVAGDVLDKYNLYAQDINPILSDEKYLEWLGDVEETVGLIAGSYYANRP